MYPKGSLCPSCGHADDPADVERIQQVQQEYQKRKQKLEKHHAIQLGLKFVLGAILIAFGVQVWFFRVYEIPVRWLIPPKEAGGEPLVVTLWVKILTAGLGGMALLLGLLLAGAKRWWPAELLCPSCDYPLDTLAREPKHCPGCTVQLQ